MKVPNEEIKVEKIIDFMKEQFPIAVSRNQVMLKIKIPYREAAYILDVLSKGNVIDCWKTTGVPYFRWRI